MPELPEVETIRRGLIPVLSGHRLAFIDARRGDLRVPLPENFAALSSNARFPAAGFSVVEMANPARVA